MHIDAHGREARLVLGASLAIGCGTNVQFSVPTIRAPTTPLSIGYIAQWLERLTADQQVPGSNPGVPSMSAILPFATTVSVVCDVHSLII